MAVEYNSGYQCWNRVIAMDRITQFVELLVNVMDCAEKEKRIILDGKYSPWDYYHIQNIVLPEIRELFSHANHGEYYFKYGKNQRLLTSTYIMTDSLKDLWNTPLGRSLLILQDFYNSI